jgi:hypothetical protein
MHNLYKKRHKSTRETVLEEEEKKQEGNGGEYDQSISCMKMSE